MSFFHQLNSTIPYMPKVVIEVPSEKMKSFLQATQRLGIDEQSIRSRELNRSRRRHNGTLFILHKIFTSFILFDWEFFSNELEYE